jgi:hypothetical protein
MIKNWFYLKKDAPGLKKETIESPSDAYVNIVDVNSPNSGNIMSVSNFATQLRPYKVYTALLTQSGGDNPIYANDAALTIGRTYTITNTDGDTVDFTNIGAPNNNLNTSFVATGTEAASWGTSALGELEYNTGAPVVTVLENTIGNVWFTYESTGAYSCYLQNAPYNKIYTNYQFIFTTVNYGNTMCRIAAEDDNLVTILTGDATTDLRSDDKLPFNTPIEIRVYN